MGDDRNARVAATFVEMADTLAGDYDIADFLHVLVERCATLLGADTAGVLLEAPDGELRLAAATSETMREIEDLEMSIREGPCLEAYHTGEQVIAEDVELYRDRWPQITPKILAMGMRSAYAFPLRLRNDRVGALNLYRVAPGPFHADDIALAQAFADVATIGILHARKVLEAERRAEQLEHALRSRIVIEQSKGILGERHGVSGQEAFEMIRAHSRSNNRPLRDVCQDILEGRDTITTKGSDAQ